MQKKCTIRVADYVARENEADGFLRLAGQGFSAAAAAPRSSSPSVSGGTVRGQQQGSGAMLHKEQGNALFKQGRYREAAEEYAAGGCTGASLKMQDVGSRTVFLAQCFTHSVSRTVFHAQCFTHSVSHMRMWQAARDCGWAPTVPSTASRKGEHMARTLQRSCRMQEQQPARRRMRVAVLAMLGKAGATMEPQD
jgi:hypothetical protein